MNTEKEPVPLLRFPASQQNEEWENVKLGNCLLQTPDYGLNAPAVPYSESLPTYLRITDITDNGKFDKSHLASVNAELTSENSLQEGDIVVARTGASVGKVYKYRKEDGLLIFAGFLIRLRPNPNKCNSEYLFQYMLSPSYKKWVNITSTRSGQPGINSTEYSSLPVPFPQKLSEQQKIAECLSSIDSYISSINEKVEQLKTHKKSLMQKLFPQKGQTVPEYRFPEFEKDGAWEEKELGELIVEIAEFTSRRNNVPLYSLTIEDGVSPKTDRYERNFLVKKEGDNFKVVHPDDFVSNPMNLRFGAIGYNKESFKVCVSGYYDVFRFKDKGTSSFWINYMKSNWALDMYDRIAIGSLYEKRRVHFSNLLRMKLLVPKYSERLKISEYLSSMEEVIGFYSEKASLLEQHKKGLMQQLFPKA